MFKIGDKVRVKNTCSINHVRGGVVTGLGDGFSRVNFGTVDYYYSNTLLESMDDMDTSERLSEVIKENQNLKQQISEQNIKLNKIQDDLKRELNDKGVRDEEFRESVDFWLKSNSSLIAEVWGEDYKNAPMSVMCSMHLSEFVNKYKEYKDKQDSEIKVGDEVNNGDATAIVTRAYEKSIYVLYRDGSCGSQPKYEYIKTGKHYDSIDEFMNS